MQEAEKGSAELKGRIGDLEKETAALVSQKEALEEKINTLQDKVFLLFFSICVPFPFNVIEHMPEMDQPGV